MKLNPAVVVLATAALASASPIRLIVVSSTTTDASGDVAQLAPHPAFRFGRPVAAIKEGGGWNSFPGPAGALDAPHHKMRRPCAGRMGLLRAKAIAISNSFRAALGWPLIETGPSHPHHPPHPPHFPQLQPLPPPPPGKFQILPFIGTPPSFIERPNVPEGHRHHGPHHHVHGKVGLSGAGGEESFMTRLHFSLLNLGTWEGRAVAFVLGCGIGVLIRMFWVLTVVAFRSIRGRNGEDHYNNNHPYTAIAIVEHIEEEDNDNNVPRSAPPTYVYPVDEKIMLEEQLKQRDQAAQAEADAEAANVPLPPSPAENDAVESAKK